MKIKNGMGVVKSLLAKHYVQVKETVDDFFREKTETMVCWAREFSEEELNKLLDELKRAPAQYKLLCHWIERQYSELKRTDLLHETGFSGAILKGLCDRQILKTWKNGYYIVSDGRIRGIQGKSFNGRTKLALQHIRSSFAKKIVFY